MHSNAEESLMLPVNVDNVIAATTFVVERLSAIGCPAKAQAQISVIIDEIFSNIVRHARGAKTAEIRFSFDPETRMVHLTFSDEGAPYNPIRHEEPNVSLPIEKRKIGGLGIFLVRKLSDGLSYEYANGKNILHVDKRI